MGDVEFAGGRLVVPDPVGGGSVEADLGRFEG
jgi:hypothetical protein